VWRDPESPSSSVQLEGVDRQEPDTGNFEVVVENGDVLTSSVGVHGRLLFAGV
jgi:hypothetical protein